MFGLEGQKSEKKSSVFVFELEKELLDPKQGSDWKKKIHDRLLSIKARLQRGVPETEYILLAKLVFGYSSFIKIINQVNLKKNNKKT